MSGGPGLNDLFPPIDKDAIALISSDVDEIVSLARRGDNLPLAAGLITAWWGLLLSVTNLYQALAQVHIFPGPIPISLIQVPLGYLGTFLLIRVGQKRRHILAWRSQVISATWLFSGIVIMLFMIGVIIDGKIGDVVANTFLALIFALNFGAMAASRLTKWLIYPAAGWITVAVMTFLLRGPPEVLSLIFGLGSLAFMFAPGIILRVHEKRLAA